MKRILILTMFLLITVSPLAVSAFTFESIGGVQIDYTQNDIVIINNYDGKNLDNLRKVEIQLYPDYNVETRTYSIAIFGDVVEFSFESGRFESEYTTFGEETYISNTLFILKNAPISTDRAYMKMNFKDALGRMHSITLGDATQIFIIPDSGKDHAETGHTLKATFNQDYIFYVETDQSDPKQHYLYRGLEDQENILLAQSPDTIFKPAMTNDRSKIFYTTGTDQYITHVIDVNSHEDTYFTDGRVFQILTKYSDPDTDYLIIERVINGKSNYFIIDQQAKVIKKLGTMGDKYDFYSKINDFIME